MTKIKVVVVEAGNDLIQVKEMDSSLKASQEFVGGWVEAVRVNDSITMWFDEDGKLKSKEANFALLNGSLKAYDVVVGDVFFTGTDGEGENVSLSYKEIEEIQSRFINRKGFKMF